MASRKRRRFRKVSYRNIIRSRFGSQGKVRLGVVRSGMAWYGSYGWVWLGGVVLGWVGLGMAVKVRQRKAGSGCVRYGPFC